MAHVLVVDDDPSLCAVLEAELGRREFRVSISGTAEDALLRATEDDDVDVILTDINLSALSGVDLCRRVVASGKDVPVVVMTAFGSMDTAIAAIRAGAYDFVTKPLDPDELSITIDRAAKERALRAEVRRLRLEVAGEALLEDMIGTSEPMRKVVSLVARVAESDATVLVTGESGSGKELVAKALHARSRRSKGPFVAINCAAMPENLLESELFGHTRGAFTDAGHARQGLFVKATGGTILLDEIGEMPPGMQAKLLRALQERTVRPVGGDQEVPFDVRIVTATNRDLEAEVAAKRFREDLYYRINVVHIAVPPLRARGRDILLLAKHMLARAQRGQARVVGFKAGVIEALLAYDWPGNVRELQNCIERAVALAEFDHLGVNDLPDKLRRVGAATVELPMEPSELITVDELERRYIQHVLRAVGGNKTLAAKVLGFDRRTLYRKLDETTPSLAPASDTAAPSDPVVPVAGTPMAAPPADARQPGAPPGTSQPIA